MAKRPEVLRVEALLVGAAPDEQVLDAAFLLLAFSEADPEVASLDDRLFHGGGPPGTGG
jgi:hypothetical protein